MVDYLRESTIVSLLTAHLFIVSNLKMTAVSLTRSDFYMFALSLSLKLASSEGRKCCNVSAVRSKFQDYSRSNAQKRQKVICLCQNYDYYCMCYEERLHLRPFFMMNVILDVLIK